MRKIRCFCLLLFALTLCSVARADDAAKVFEALRSKVLTVHDYTAQVKMKINVSYMHIPQLAGTLYFKGPDKMRLERHGGLSILPKKNINLTLSNLIPSGKVIVIDEGTTVLEGKKVRMMKVIPDDDRSEIVLTKMWVDEANLLAVRTETTTRNDGTVIMELEYGRYISYALPDKVTIFMDLKDYKLPKGVTMDYNDLPEKKTGKEAKTRKGTIQISYISYSINTGLSDHVFTANE